MNNLEWDVLTGVIFRNIKNDSLWLPSSLLHLLWKALVSASTWLFLGASSGSAQWWSENLGGLENSSALHFCKTGDWELSKHSAQMELLHSFLLTIHCHLWAVRRICISHFSLSDISRLYYLSGEWWDLSEFLYCFNPILFLLEQNLKENSTQPTHTLIRTIK